MEWNSLTLYVLGLFGLLSLVATLLTSFFKQVPELADAVRAAWRSLRGERRRDEEDDGALP